ncbi:hypothetical protein QBC40DRAFT_313411 [Triangularia verruculosa]|uniref:C2H2-type domain-containing protein n=1 Tax=Triangularia verruculosa TaxID=2587418 RepID=A0AAN7AYS1_9PEZI|nr:hypothetical protein QBC40DRAFT_313411 [Triangularia verruculosa]
MDFLRIAKSITDGVGFVPGSDAYFEDYFGRVRTMMEENGFNVDAQLVVCDPPPVVPVDPYLGAPLEAAPGPAYSDISAPAHVASELTEGPANPAEFDFDSAVAVPATPAGEDVPGEDASGEDAPGVDSPNAGNERIKCPHSGCPTDFKTQASLTTHITNQHAAKEGNSCYICDGTWRNSSTLRRHLEDHHKLQKGVLDTALKACDGLKSVDIKWLQPRFNVQNLISLLDVEIAGLQNTKDEVRKKYRQLNPPAQAKLEHIQRERLRSEDESFPLRQPGMDQMELIHLLIKVRKDFRAWNTDLEEIKRNMEEGQV